MQRPTRLIDMSKGLCYALVKQGEAPDLVCQQKWHGITKGCLRLGRCE